MEIMLFTSHPDPNNEIPLSRVLKICETDVKTENHKTIFLYFLFKKTSSIIVLTSFC